MSTKPNRNTNPSPNPNPVDMVCGIVDVAPAAANTIWINDWHTNDAIVQCTQLISVEAFKCNEMEHSVHGVVCASHADISAPAAQHTVTSTYVKMQINASHNSSV